MLEVDQSGKVERKNMDTVVAFCNKNMQLAVLMKKKDKRIVFELFKELGRPKDYIFFTFAMIIALTISRYKLAGKILIDEEYPGRRDLIKLKILQYLERLNYHDKNLLITFGLVGKRSKAHELSNRTASGKKKADWIISGREIKKIGFYLR